ncbi:hypothetical protein [Mangrovibacterium marinum]|uniref:Uncharacterized protein n=1 Tax=Mangrovibacterium marinum TaxID=1639118 RepID=A0A2T5C0P4_9BACT|nr:hypothetical protein [Mangrovibacterium marinum]PTN08177.1 hypothetical protein C8N47_11063 [Mangrovibacterium marinum]
MKVVSVLQKKPEVLVSYVLERSSGWRVVSSCGLQCKMQLLCYEVGRGFAAFGQYNCECRLTVVYV